VPRGEKEVVADPLASAGHGYSVINNAHITDKRPKCLPIPRVAADAEKGNTGPRPMGAHQGRAVVTGKVRKIAYA
jgi:hypothetical protein